MLLGEWLFFDARSFSFVGEFDAVGADADEFVFVEVAHGLFEHFLADTEHGVDFIGWRLVVVGREAFLGEFEVLEESGGEVADEDTAVGWRVAVDGTGWTGVMLLRDGFLKLLNLAGADDAVGLVVDVAIDLITLATLHTHLLFAEGAEEILHQAPMEVGAVFVGPGTFEVSELSHFNEWVFGGGDEAFLLVEIEEDVEGVAYLDAFGHIAFRQQNVADVAAFEINAMLFSAQDFQLVPLA